MYHLIFFEYWVLVCTTITGGFLVSCFFFLRFTWLAFFGRWSLASFICTTNLQTLTILGPIAPGPWLPEIVPWVCTWKNAESIESRCINLVKFYLQLISWCQGLKSLWVNLLHWIVGPKALTAISCGRSTGATRISEKKRMGLGENLSNFFCTAFFSREVHVIQICVWRVKLMSFF